IEFNKQYMETTVGRVILNDVLPDEMPFINGLLKKKGLTQLVQRCYLHFGLQITVRMLDRIKELGFTYATRAGISIGIDDMVVPASKHKLVNDAEKEVMDVQSQYQEGAITTGERYNKIIEIWSKVTDKVSGEMFKVMEEDDRTGRVLNPIYIMADSGARGSKQQIRQLSGMRGLMAKPSGEIIETPITANFREGLNVLQYFISTHGARKGLADTALKTADSGYLTRRLCDVAQDVIVTDTDCGTQDGIYVEPIMEGQEVIEPLRDRIVGRVALEDQVDFEGNVIVHMNEEITEETASAIQAAGIERVKIRSVLTCESRRGVCMLCYGRNLATGRTVERGEAVGIISAQSIGEPGTQLTMRTFHVGGTASGGTEQNRETAKTNGLAKFIGIYAVRNSAGELIAMNRNGIIAIVDEKGRERERYPVAYSTKIMVEDGAPVHANQDLLTWDPYTFQILSEVSGIVHFKDMIDGVTMSEQVDEITGMSQFVVVDSPDEKKVPTIIVRPHGGGKADEKRYLMPTHAHLNVHDGDEIHAGEVLAKIPRAASKTKDITGGLPRVVELFEARKPRDPAVIAEINGIAKYGEVTKGYRKISIQGDDGVVKEYNIPRGAHIGVQDGERVRVGDPLMDGPRNPHDILHVLGEKELQKYLVGEIQEVYRLQGVNINDKHLEVIVRQMMRWVKIEDIGDTEFLPEEIVDRFKFREENTRVIEAGGRPATGKPTLLGITKASLSTDSFISAASFQETTRVLTEAAINGKVDNLRGLKENVIMGRLIPAGTGMDYYRRVKIAGEDIIEEEPIQEPDVLSMEGLGGYEEETRPIYSGGLSEEIPPDDTIGDVE
nr:DNA-directed RNA polymerase subunit beta' [Bryobacter sp.]